MQYSYQSAVYVRVGSPIANKITWNPSCDGVGIPHINWIIGISIFIFRNIKINKNIMSTHNWNNRRKNRRCVTLILLYFILLLLYIKNEKVHWKYTKNNSLITKINENRCIALQTTALSLEKFAATKHRACSGHSKSKLFFQKLEIFLCDQTRFDERIRIYPIQIILNKYSQPTIFLVFFLFI